MVESHWGATIVVINVQGFPLSPGRGLLYGYILVGLSLCDVIAASFFCIFFFSSSMIHCNWPIGTIIK